MLESLVWILKLWPFVREVFLKNEDFRKAILNNKTLVVLLSTSLFLLIMSGSNARSFYDITLKHRQLKRENTALRSQFEGKESEIASMRETIRLKEEQVYELKVSNSTLRFQLGIVVEK